jgi:hypothetical protein
MVVTPLASALRALAIACARRAPGSFGMPATGFAVHPPRQVLMPVDQTGKQRRAGPVVDDLNVAGRLLDRTHPDQPPALIDKDLAA